jgi:putative drug exporter of the RND superfamily
MFERLGRFTYRRRRPIAIAWLVIVLAGMALSSAVMPKLTASPSGGADLEALRVAERLREVTDHGPQIVAVVELPAVDAAATAAEVVAASAEIADLPGVASVLDPYTTGSPAMLSTDGGAALVVVGLERGLDHHAHAQARDDAIARLRAIEAAEVSIGGDAVIDGEYAHAIEKDLAAEQKVLPLAFVVLVIILGGLIAAGLPMLVALAAVGGTMFVLMGATGAMDVSVYAMNVVFMFGLGLGIDYGLLMVSRFREERAGGAEIAIAVERSVATAGRTVTFSAMTVAASLAGLFAFDDPTFRSFGVAGIGVVAVALLASLTLLPALLSLWGRGVKPARASRDRRRFFNFAQLVQRHAVIVVLVVGIALVAVATPFASARFENGDARYLPRSSEVRAVALTLLDRFPSRGADPILVVAETAADHPDLVTYLRGIEAMPGVAAASPWHHGPVDATVLEVVPEGTSQGPTAQRIVHELRAERPEFGIEVGGTAAMLVDLKAETMARLPIALGVIAVATFVLLFLMTGSIAVPVKAIVMNVLSLGASFGALVWGFQQGHLAGVLDFDPVGSLDLFMPVLIFIFAFGLSMDYEVFLLGRVKEIYDETGDNDYAVAEGLQRTGGIITSAAMLIVIVFAGFAMGEVLGIKMLGFGLALAVVVDATIVRTLLVPATMTLLGSWNWWAPAPLRRLHARFGLGETPSMDTVVASSGAPLEPAQAAVPVGR